MYLSLAPASYHQGSGFSAGHGPTLWAPHRPLWGPLVGNHYTPSCGWTSDWPFSSPPEFSDDFFCLCQEVQCCTTSKIKNIYSFMFKVVKLNCSVKSTWMNYECALFSLCHLFIGWCITWVVHWLQKTHFDTTHIHCLMLIHESTWCQGLGLNAKSMTSSRI